MGYLMGLKECTVVRDAHHGDRGYNPSKPRMVVVNLPGDGQRTVPFDSLTVTEEEPAPVAAPVVQRRGRR